MTSHKRDSTNRQLQLRLIAWSSFAVVALLLPSVDDLVLWTTLVVPGALLVALIPGLTPRTTTPVDRTDLLVVSVVYVTVAGAFRLAFTVFTTDNVLGLFVAFATGLLVGVVGPVVYQVRKRTRCTDHDRVTQEVLT